MDRCMSLTAVGFILVFLGIFMLLGHVMSRLFELEKQFSRLDLEVKKLDSDLSRVRSGVSGPPDDCRKEEHGDES